MEEIFEEIRSELYGLSNTFSKARGEWNDGYTQGLRDALSLVGDAERRYKLNNKKVDEKNLSYLDLDMFKKNYFKKDQGKQ